jgi:diguanylate cyclase (GGDEF)-like protein
VASGGVTAASGGHAAGVDTACQAVVDLLAVDARLLPRVWLERDGRLRCVARAEVWHARDGLPATTGVVGRTFTTATETLVTRTDPSAGDSACRVRICVPLRCGDRVAGVLDVESGRPLSLSGIAHVRDCAAELGTRIAALGGPPATSPARRLLGHVALIAELEDLRAIAEATVAAALDVVPLDAAVLVRANDDGALEAVSCAGALADTLAATPPRALAALAAQVRGATSCYAIGSADDPLDPAVAHLRAAGVRALVVIGLIAHDELSGMLLLVTRAAARISTDDVELLELLAGHAAASVHASDHVRALRERAATDPLTGLGHYATFHEALAASHRRPTTAVVLCDIDGFKRLNDSFGHQHGDQVLRAVAAALSSALRRGDALFRIGGDEFAVLVAVSDESEALDAGLRLRDAVHAAALGVTVSLGVAVPRGDEETDSALLARADRALYRVKEAGRDGVALADDDPLAIAPLP